MNFLTVVFQIKMASAAGQDDPAGEHNKQPVIMHVKEDSNSELEALFDISLNKQGVGRPLQVPLRMRNLPASFWQPPTIGSKSPSVHSRENSLDNSLGTGPFSPGPIASPGPPGIGPSHHSRANSCPATLGQTLAAAQQHQNHALNQNHAHVRQHSYDVGGGEDLGQLPPGWEKATTPTGQIYFMNHITKTTQWEDPRKAINNQRLKQLNGTASPRSAVSPVPRNAQGELQLGPLANGWEQSVTDAGEIYFINHKERTTTWYDPRLPIASQQIPLKHGQQSIHEVSQALQMEHERRLQITKKQQEWRKLENRKNQLQRQIQRPRSASQENVAMTQAQEMMMRHSLSDGVTGHTSIDPFLGQGNPGEAHNRQESADSGLGMGSNFNLGSIPEDMGLENMDTADLDTTLTESSLQGQQQQQGMETEELIPTLPELGDELSNDIMQTILNTNKVEDNSLTWL